MPADLALHARQAAHQLGLVLRVAVAEVARVRLRRRPTARARWHRWRPHRWTDGTPVGTSDPTIPPGGIDGRIGRRAGPALRLDCGPMDPRDGLRPTLEDVACTACGAGVPADRLRILARRDDLTFVEIPMRRLRQPHRRPPDRRHGARRPPVPRRRHGPPAAGRDVVGGSHHLGRRARDARRPGRLARRPAPAARRPVTALVRARQRSRDGPHPRLLRRPLGLRAAHVPDPLEPRGRGRRELLAGLLAARPGPATSR